MENVKSYLAGIIEICQETYFEIEKYIVPISEFVRNSEVVHSYRRTFDIIYLLRGANHNFVQDKIYCILVFWSVIVYIKFNVNFLVISKLTYSKIHYEPLVRINEGSLYLI